MPSRGMPRLVPVAGVRVTTPRKSSPAMSEIFSSSVIASRRSAVRSAGERPVSHHGCSPQRASPRAELPGSPLEPPPPSQAASATASAAIVRTIPFMKTFPLAVGLPFAPARTCAGGFRKASSAEAMSVPEIEPPAATAFAALKPESVQFLLGRAHTVPLHAGDTFLREGDPGGDLYVVRTGRVE